MADPRIEFELQVEGGQLARVIERLRAELPAGEALDAERRGEPFPCPRDHDAIWYDDEDGVLRCAACHQPVPHSHRVPR